MELLRRPKWTARPNVTISRSSIKSSLKSSSSSSNSSIIVVASNRLDSYKSRVLQSALHARDNLIVISIAFLESLDYLQERLNLPLNVVRRLKLQLKELIDGRILSQTTECGGGTNNETTQHLARRIAESEAWARATTEDVIGFVSWIGSVWWWLNRIAISSVLGIASQALVLITYIPGVPRGKAMFHKIYTVLETIVLQSQELGGATPGSSAVANHHLGSKDSSPLGDVAAQYASAPWVTDESMTSLTARVLSYHEKDADAQIVRNVSRRIHRMMHFQVSLKPFEATVVLPDSTGHDDTASVDSNSSSTSSSSNNNTHRSSKIKYYAMTPRSIPASPTARSRVETAFSNFSDDVLYQARDQLRKERAETLSGEPQRPIPTFDPMDSHEDIFLSCGLHCASKLGQGLYRSCRGTFSLPTNRYIYFQMSVASALDSSSSTDVAAASSSSHDPVSNNLHNGICVGLSTKQMPLNTLVGTWKRSIGFYSSGHIITGAQWRNYVSVDASYGSGDTVGVLVYVDEYKQVDSDGELMNTVRVQFLINGRQLRDAAHEATWAEFLVPKDLDIYPTVTLYSVDTQVLSRFASADIITPHIGEIAVDSSADVWCLDGTRLRVPSSSIIGDDDDSL